MNTLKKPYLFFDLFFIAEYGTNFFTAVDISELIRIFSR